MKQLLFALLTFFVASTLIAADDYYVLPFKPDPAIQVDAKLGDWANVPNAIVLNKKANVSYGTGAWKTSEDLSATVRLSWRPGVLAIAVEVTDDQFHQPYRGPEIWKGDHFNLWMDTTPGEEPERTEFGEGQFHLVVSSGNFSDILPEIYVYQPEGQNPGSGEVAARRTDTGYILEALIPMERVKFGDVVLGKTTVNFEVAISDADSLPAKQETLLTYGTSPWTYSRARLLPLVFGDGNGNAPPPEQSITLLAHSEIPALETMTLEFEAEAVPEGKDPFLFLNAIVPSKRAGGFCSPAMKLELNGEIITGDRLSNRPMKSLIMYGTTNTFMAANGAISVCYSPDFVQPQNHPQYGFADGTNPTEYEFNLAGLVHEGKNTLVFKNMKQKTEKQPYTIRVGNVAYRIKTKALPPPPPKPAPTGPLAFLAPQTEFSKTYSALQHTPRSVTFTINDKTTTVTSRYSTPDGNWQTDSNAYFSLTRKVIQHDEWIEVQDTFTNLTDANLPIKQEHVCDLNPDFKASWLGGVHMPSGDGLRITPQNPSLFGTTNSFGIGMLALNDEFVVHVRQTADNGVLSLSDPMFYLPPGKTYTAEWAIMPTAKPDFWQFTNAARRLRDVNFPLRHVFAFMFYKKPVYDWTEQRFRSFVDNKGANFLVQSLSVRNKNGYYARCTDWNTADLSEYRDFQKRVRDYYPGGEVQTGIYYDCFLDTTRENDEKFKADRALDSAGNHIDYGGKHTYMHYFIPTLEPGHWGEEVAKTVDVILDDIGADGIFWDEFTHSRGDYVFNHEDGCSADIDPKTHKIRRTKGNVALVSLPFRLEQVRRIQEGDHPLIVNGAPYCRSMIDKKFMAFTETGSITNCRKMLLYSPVTLGDHLTEHKYADSYGVMHAALDHGCLYVWYSHIFHDHVAPTKYMFPFTPIELHSGYLHGKERIVTNRSGNFGWGDQSDFEPHVFNSEGIEDPGFKVPKVTEDGATYAELRLPEGFFAILVRK